MLVPHALELHLGAQTIQERRYELIKESQILAIFWLVSFIKTSKHLIYLETQSYACVLDTVEEVIISMQFVLLGASTIMTTLRVWQIITYNMQNFWRIKAILLLLPSKQLPRL